MNTAHLNNPSTAHLDNPSLFILAGKATFTVQNEKTGNRFTFMVSENVGEGPTHFVSLLSGPDNTSDYTYIGCIWDGIRFAHGKKSRVSKDAMSVRAFGYVFEKILSGNLPECIKIYHSGRCGRCGRKLTTPKSVQLGFGPECEKHL